ncbi:hypothetical protein EGW08_009228 [Elysia chlorotica]|uniref:Uncharacterized protein n=1 Tax=Elysia chlorotica TaxID=188477 RepID=A0A433TN94_ELYCH|nr:hypothetical protein EGW08_009228 [Elysia chlorotica]
MTTRPAAESAESFNCHTILTPGGGFNQADFNCTLFGDEALTEHYSETRPTEGSPRCPRPALSPECPVQVSTKTVANCHCSVEGGKNYTANDALRYSVTHSLLM